MRGRREFFNVMLGNYNCVYGRSLFLKYTGKYIDILKERTVCFMVIHKNITGQHNWPKLEGGHRMEIIKFETISFNWQDILANSLKKDKRKEASPEMAEAAEKAYIEGVSLLDMCAVVEIYKKDDNDGQYIILSLPGRDSDRVYIGPCAGYLMPADEVAITLCTVGAKLVARMSEYSSFDDYLTMYYMDVLGVQALAEVSARVRSHVESLALKKSWGVGPSMQPGSVDGWTVEGQKDLYRLGHGGKIDLSLNDSCFLIPYISDSAIIGLGQHYSSSKVGSMCDKCPRFKECLWRRENVWK